MAETIRVEVVLALPGEQQLRRLDVPAGTTAWEAVGLAGFAGQGDASVDPQRLGVFSRRVEPGRVLEDGDRVEIYRPLALDPKEARRRRAAR